MQLRRALGALRGGCVFGPVDQVVESERATRRLPVPFGVEHVETQPPFVGSSVRADEHTAETLAGNVSLRFGLENRRRDDVVAQRPHCCAEQRDVDERTLARTLALE